MTPAPLGAVLTETRQLAAQGIVFAAALALALALVVPFWLVEGWVGLLGGYVVLDVILLPAMMATSFVLHRRLSAHATMPA